MDKVDKNKDGFVTDDELKDWIKHVADRYVVRRMYHPELNDQWMQLSYA